MKRCIIITAYIEGNIKEFLDILPGDYIICADKGYIYALEENITPDFVLGDFDSLESGIPDFPKDKLLTFPVEKDDTDTMLALKHALCMDFDKIIIAGGLGGRLDHTIANLQCLNWIYTQQDIKVKKRPDICIIDGKNQVYFLSADEYFSPAHLIIHGNPGDKFSLLSFERSCIGVDAAPAKWPLYNATLSTDFPLGISNQFTETSCNIQLKKGKLLVILSRD